MSNEQMGTFSEIDLDNGKTLKIIHNLKVSGPINSLEAAVENWLQRTTEPTEQGLCDYITSKGTHFAYPASDYKIGPTKQP